MPGHLYNPFPIATLYNACSAILQKHSCRYRLINCTALFVKGVEFRLGCVGIGLGRSSSEGKESHQSMYVITRSIVSVSIVLCCPSECSSGYLERGAKCTAKCTAAHVCAVWLMNFRDLRHYSMIKHTPSLVSSICTNYRAQPSWCYCVQLIEKKF